MVGDFTIEEAVAADAGADAGFVEEGVETSAPTETAALSVGDFDSTHFASAVLGPFAVGYDGSGGMGAGSIHAQNASNSQQQTQAQKDRSAAATAQMTTAMQAQQAAYQAAYNNEVSLNIGGEDVEIKQGDLHKGLRARRQQLEEQIQQIRESGGTPSAALLQRYEDFLEGEEAADPSDGHKMDEEQRALIQSLADKYPDDMAAAMSMGLENEAIAAGDMRHKVEGKRDVGVSDADSRTPNSEGFQSTIIGLSSSADVLQQRLQETGEAVGPRQGEMTDENMGVLRDLVGDYQQDAASLQQDSSRSMSAAGSHFDDAPGLTAAFSQALANGEQSDATTAPDVSAPSSEDDVQLPPQTASVNIGFGNGLV